MTCTTQDPIYGRALARPRLRRRRRAVPLVVVHGGGPWEELRPHFGGREPIALELPEGERDGVAWLAREIDELGGPVDLVGHDRAAIVAQSLVRDRPHLVRSWILLGLDHQRRVQLLVAAGMPVLPADRAARGMDPALLAGGPLRERLRLAS